jgi:UDP-glucose 4-epimerase
MKALVTGAAGFVGSHIVDALLERGDEVVALDRCLRGKALSDQVLARVRHAEVDIFDAAAVGDAAQDCAAIFHCAAVVGVDAYVAQPTRTMETEEVGLRNVCHAARAQKSSLPVVVFASSSAVYGEAGGAEGLVENLEVAPGSSYGVAKRFGELYLAAQNSEYGLRSAALRIFNVYGPRQDDRLVLPRFIRSALADKALELYGDGLQTRDFVFVKDVVRTMLTAASDVRGCEIINACSGSETSILSLAEMVIATAKSKSRVAHKPRPEKRSAFELARSFGSRGKAEKLLGPLPVTPLSDGLSATIASVAAAAVSAPVTRVD